MLRSHLSTVVSGTVIVIRPIPPYAPAGTTTFQLPTISVPPRRPSMNFEPVRSGALATSGVVVVVVGVGDGIGSRFTDAAGGTAPELPTAGACPGADGAVGSAEQLASASRPAIKPTTRSGRRRDTCM